MYKYFFGKYRGTSGITGFEKTSGTAFTVFFYRAFDTNGSDSKGAAEFGLSSATIDMELADDHLECWQIILFMEKYGKSSVKIGHPTILFFKSQVDVNFSGSTGKEWELCLRHVELPLGLDNL